MGLYLDDFSYKNICFADKFLDMETGLVAVGEWTGQVGRHWQIAWLHSRVQADSYYKKSRFSYDLKVIKFLIFFGIICGWGQQKMCKIILIYFEMAECGDLLSYFE